MVSLTLFTAVIASLAVIPIAISEKKIDKTVEFYFVYCYQTDGEAAAASFSSAVDSFGGAGYTLEYGGTYYATAACYYSYGDALSVCEALNQKGTSCGVLSAIRQSFYLTTKNALNNSDLYGGIITTLYELSEVIYQCANGFDSGEFGSAAVKDIMENVKGCVSALINAGGINCFYQPLQLLTERRENCTQENSHSKYIRATQIAIADTLLNITLT